MKRKLLMLAILALGVMPVSGILWYRWDSAQNRGLEFGYYGSANRVKHALQAMPGVKITREWANQDVTVKAFGFDVRTKEGQVIHLFVGETDPIRKLTGEKLIVALSKRMGTLGAPRLTLPAR